MTVVHAKAAARLAQSPKAEKGSDTQKEQHVLFEPALPYKSQNTLYAKKSLTALFLLVIRNVKIRCLQQRAASHRIVVTTDRKKVIYHVK